MPYEEELTVEGFAGFENGMGPWAKEFRQLLESGFALRISRRKDFHQTSYLPIKNLCFKPPVCCNLL